MEGEGKWGGRGVNNVGQYPLERKYLPKPAAVSDKFQTYVGSWGGPPTIRRFRAGTINHPALPVCRPVIIPQTIIRKLLLY